LKPRGCPVPHTDSGLNANTVGVTSYAVFLRGINVNGISIKMADLRTALEPLPVENVRTILASGNVVVDSHLPGSELKATIESSLRTRFGYDAWVVVITTHRVAELAAACPYPADDPTTHAYITLASDASALDELGAAAAAAQPPDVSVVRLGPEAIAWTAPVGATLETAMSKLTGAARYKRSTTKRNLRTLLRIGGA